MSEQYRCISLGRDEYLVRELCLGELDFESDKFLLWDVDAVARHCCYVGGNYSKGWCS